MRHLLCMSFGVSEVEQAEPNAKLVAQRRALCVHAYAHIMGLFAR